MAHDTLLKPVEYADHQTQVTYTGVINVVFVIHSTLGYAWAVLSLEQGLTFLFYFVSLHVCEPHNVPADYDV